MVSKAIKTFVVNMFELFLYVMQAGFKTSPTYKPI